MVGFARSVVGAFFAVFAGLASADCDRLWALLDQGKFQEVISLGVSSSGLSESPCELNAIGLALVNQDVDPSLRVRSLDYFGKATVMEYPSAAYNALLFSLEFQQGDPEKIVGALVRLIELGVADDDSRAVARASYSLLVAIQKNCEEFYACAVPKEQLEESILKASDLMISGAVNLRQRTVDNQNFADGIVGFLSIAAVAVNISQSVPMNHNNSSCNYFSCEPFLSTQELYRLGVMQ